MGANKNKGLNICFCFRKSLSDPSGSRTPARRNSSNTKREMNSDYNVRIWVASAASALMLHPWVPLKLSFLAKSQDLTDSVSSLDWHWHWTRSLQTKQKEAAGVHQQDNMYRSMIFNIVFWWSELELKRQACWTDLEFLSLKEVKATLFIFLAMFTRCFVSLTVRILIPKCLFSLWNNCHGHTIKNKQSMITDIALPFVTAVQRCANSKYVITYYMTYTCSFFSNVTMHLVWGPSAKLLC